MSCSNMALTNRVNIIVCMEAQWWYIIFSKHGRKGTKTTYFTSIHFHFNLLSGMEETNASGSTLTTLEEAFLKHFLDFTREQAKGIYQFCILKTLRGPQLSTDSHMHNFGKQFYFHWKAGFEMVWELTWTNSNISFCQLL